MDGGLHGHVPAMRLSDCTRLVCVCRVRVAGRCGQAQAGAEINAMPFFLSSYISPVSVTLLKLSKFLMLFYISEY